MADNQVIKLSSAFSKIGNQSPYVQIAVGAGGGFVSGFVVFKVIKIFCLVTGGAILTLELALQAGLVTITWGKVIKSFGFEEEELTQPPARRAPDRTPTPEPRFIDPFANIKRTILNSARLCFAFIGGFLIGLGVA